MKKRRGREIIAIDKMIAIILIQSCFDIRSVSERLAFVNGLCIVTILERGPISLS